MELTEFSFQHANIIWLRAYRPYVVTPRPKIRLPEHPQTASTVQPTPDSSAATRLNSWEPPAHATLLYSSGPLITVSFTHLGPVPFLRSAREQLSSFKTQIEDSCSLFTASCPASPSTYTIGLANLFFILHRILYLWRTL